MKIQIKKLKPNATLPTCADKSSAGYDLYVLLDKEDGDKVPVFAGETRFFNTGIAVAIPEGYFGGVYARSGLSCKKGGRLANCVGVIDASYRGEVRVALHNDSKIPLTICNGDRIAQLVIQRFEPIEWNEVTELPETERQDNGFGSSGR